MLEQALPVGDVLIAAALPLAIIAGLLHFRKVNAITIQHPILLDLVASVKAGAASLIERADKAEQELATVLANGAAFEAEVVELKDALVAVFQAPATVPEQAQPEIDPVTQAPPA
jgi:hypothetical protein